MLHTLFRTSLPVVAAALALAALPAPAAEVTYRAELSGAQIVPDPAKTPASSGAGRAYGKNGTAGGSAFLRRN